MSRIADIRKNLIGTEGSDDLMMELMEACNDTVTPIPVVGNFYFFVYAPKTPGIRYDQNPLIACTDMYQWGFRGINFHWNKPRNYTWNEIVGQLYQVYDNELNHLDSIPFANFRINI